MGKMLHEPIALDVNHMMSDVIGFQYGIDPCQVDGMKDAASAAQRNVEKNRGTGWLGWMQLPYDQEEVVSHIERVAKSVREQFDTFVVLGNQNEKYLKKAEEMKGRPAGKKEYIL